MPKVSLVSQLGQMALGSLVANGVRRAANSGAKRKRRSAVKTTPALRRRRGGSRTIVRRRRKTVSVNNSNEHREVALASKARAISTRALASLSLEPNWFRVQGLTQFDTTNGFYACASRLNTTSGLRILPMHVWDLTCLNNVNSTDVGFACTQTAAGACGTTALASQNSGGGTGPNSFLSVENTTGLSGNFRKALHEWSSVRLNLYGVRARATKWRVSVIMVKDEYADFLNATDTNTEKRKLYDALCRGYMFNNLATADPQGRVDYKVLKDFTCIIDPITNDMVNGAAAVPRIQTVKWFMPHNRVRRYDWRRADTPLLAADAAWDTEVGTAQVLNDRTHPTHRVYLVIRAMSPSRREDAAITAQTDADEATEPSYDLLLRQKFNFTT